MLMCWENKVKRYKISQYLYGLRTGENSLQFGLQNLLKGVVVVGVVGIGVVGLVVDFSFNFGAKLEIEIQL